MTKLRVTHNSKEKTTTKHTLNLQLLKSVKNSKLRVSALSLATAIGALGVSQVACAELTWGDGESFEQEGSYYSGNSYQQGSSGVDYFNAAAQAENRGDISALFNYEQLMSGSLFAMYPTY